MKRLQVSSRACGPVGGAFAAVGGGSSRSSILTLTQTPSTMQRAAPWSLLEAEYRWQEYSLVCMHIRAQWQVYCCRVGCCALWWHRPCSRRLGKLLRAFQNQHPVQHVFVGGKASASCWLTLGDSKTNTLSQRGLEWGVQKPLEAWKPPAETHPLPERGLWKPIQFSDNALRVCLVPC